MTHPTAVDFWNGTFADADGIPTPDGHEADAVAHSDGGGFVRYLHQQYLLLQKL